jgi:predicted alpha/beta hydrolase family esterase
MKAPVLVLPGWLNSGPQHWQSLWERDHPEFRRVRQKDWNNPLVADWVTRLDDAIAGCSGPPVLVAHSLGCATIAHWASKHSRPVHGALLVAPTDLERSEAPEALHNFRPIPRARLPFPSIVVASSNDPWLTMERAAEFSSAWGSRLENAGPAGHINADAGFGPWPMGEMLLGELMSSRTQMAGRS